MLGGTMPVPLLIELPRGLLKRASRIGTMCALTAEDAGTALV